MLAVGDSLPNLTVADDSGAPVSLAALRATPLVVWFYPRADTPG